MLDTTHSDKDHIFNYYAPQGSYKGIVSIPHSGEHIPAEFVKYLTTNTSYQNQDVDFRVNQLVDIDKLIKNGIAVIVSNIHRICVDLNRAQDICILNWKSNSHGHQLVTSEPSADQLELMTHKYYSPYYEMLKAMINELHSHSKQEISLIDLHSMPSRPTKYHLEINPNQKMQRPSFCVSDIEGLSCTKDFIEYTCQQLKGFDKDVSQNDPYFGGHVTRFIHKNYQRINNIQIEISRSIYMDETKKELTKGLVENLKPNLTNALISVFDHFSS